MSGRVPAVSPGLDAAALASVMRMLRSAGESSAAAMDVSRLLLPSAFYRLHSFIPSSFHFFSAFILTMSFFSCKRIEDRVSLRHCKGE